MSQREGGRGLRILFTRFVVATFVVFVHFAPEISSYQRVRNRFFRQWETRDALALTLDVLLLGLLVTAAVQFLDRPRWPRVRGAIRALFVLGLVSGIVANINPVHRPHTLSFEVLWLLIAGVVGYSYGRPQSRLVRWAYRASLVFSPLVPIVLLQMFTWSTWAEPWREPRVSFPERAAPPVFVFVFDEWSFARAAPGGQFRPGLKNLRELATRSFFFRNAHSPGDDTYRSVPLLIYGEHPLRELPNVFAKEGKEGAEFVTGDQRSRRIESIFDMARAAKYNTAAIGFYMPYEHMLGDVTDFCRGFAFYPTGSTLVRHMALDALEAMRYETDPISRHVFRLVYASAFTRHWLEMKDQFADAIEVAIERMPTNTLTFVHYPLPHAPFVYNEDGTFRGVFRVDFHRPDGDMDGAWGTEEDYLRQLGYLDHRIGQLMDRLKRAGKFDGALIVLTSDHSWRLDPEPRLRTEARRWVPLVIKMPGQTQGCVVDEPYSNVRFQAFLRQVLTGNANDPSITALIARCVAPAAN